MILSSKSDVPGIVDKCIVNDSFGLCTTNGLVKTVNEDRIGYKNQGDSLRICIADGHWGQQAAEVIAEQWLRVDLPQEFSEAVELAKRTERSLYESFGSLNMDESRDFTPEASFVAVKIRGNEVDIVGYGDCRLAIIREGRAYSQLPTKATWLGAFSYLGLRNRIPVETGLILEHWRLVPGDQLILFTDGVDECVYEKPTISMAELAGLAHQEKLSQSVDAVLAKIMACGAEDNASFAIFRA